MRNSKFIIALLVILATVTILVACRQNDMLPETGTGTGHQEASPIEKSSEIDESNNKKEPATSAAPNGTETVVPNYEIFSIGEFSNGLALIVANTGYGYIDTKGTVIIEPIYENAYPFKDALAPVRKDGLYGYIDTEGKIVIDFMYNEVSDFIDGIAAVTVDDTTKYINRRGNVIYSVTGKEIAIGGISNGYFWVETEEALLSGNVPTLTYYNSDCQVAFSLYGARHNPNYNASAINEHGYASAITNSETIVVFDTTGNLVIPQSANVSFIKDSYLYSDDFYYFDYTSKCLLPASFLRSLDMAFTRWSDSDLNGHEVYLGSVRGAWSSVFASLINMDNLGQYYCDVSLILQNNQILLNLKEIPAFSGAKRFQGVGCNEIGGKLYFTVRMVNSDDVVFYAIIDENGKASIPTNQYNLGHTQEKTVNYSRYIYYIMYTFHADLCKAQDTATSLYGYIDLQGNWVIQPQYESVSDFYGEGDDAVAVVNNNTIINRKGEVIFTIASNE